MATTYFALLLSSALILLWEWRAGKRSPRTLVQTRVDKWYWFFVTPFITGVLTRATTFGVLVAVTSSGKSSLPQTFISSTPALFQFGIALILADAVGYVSHRIRHTQLWWRFHAIHHSATSLDALAAARMHPLDDMLDNTLVGATLLLLGFDWQVYAWMGPLLLLHTAFTHSNMQRGWGRLEYFIVTLSLIHI